MRKWLLCMFFGVATLVGRPQNCNTGLFADYATTFSGKQKTFALTGQFELSFTRSNKWFLNWEYGFGTTQNMDFYGRAGFFMTLYGSEAYWMNVVGNSNSFGEMFGALLFPAICPNGLTHYFYKSTSNKIQVGFYFNPFQLDYWDRTEETLSWTINSGFKWMYNFSNNNALAIRLGGMKTYNIRGPQQGNILEDFQFNLSLGLIKSSTIKW